MFPRTGQHDKAGTAASVRTNVRRAMGLGIFVSDQWRIRKAPRPRPPFDGRHGRGILRGCAAAAPLRSRNFDNAATDAPAATRCHAQSNVAVPREKAEGDPMFCRLTFDLRHHEQARLGARIVFFDGGSRDGIMRALEEQALFGLGA